MVLMKFILFVGGVKFGRGTVATPETHKGNLLPFLSGVVIDVKVFVV